MKTVRLLPKVCELAGTTLGARLRTVPRWWRGGQAGRRGAYLADLQPQLGESNKLPLVWNKWMAMITVLRLATLLGKPTGKSYPGLNL